LTLLQKSGIDFTGLLGRGDLGGGGSDGVHVQCIGNLSSGV
jgi:hypothetical protein